MTETLLVPGDRVELAIGPFDDDGAEIAFRPGMWMYHCHILEHHAAGMMGHLEVVR